MRVLRIYPTANDARHRCRDLALRRLGLEVALVAPNAYGSTWGASPIEREMPHRRARVINKGSIPLHLWDPLALRRAVHEFDPDVVDIHEEPYFPAGAQGVLAAGCRPVPEKGIDDLLDFGPRLLCVGDGPLAGAVRAVGGEVTAARSTDELAEQLGRMAVLAAPSRTTPAWKEQFGRMIIEAMAAGVPVVAYASGA